MTTSRPKGWKFRKMLTADRKADLQLLANVYVVYSSSSNQALGDTIFRECVAVIFPAVQRLVGINRNLPIIDRVADNWYSVLVVVGRLLRRIFSRN